MCTFFICSMNCERQMMTKRLNNNSLSNSLFLLLHTLFCELSVCTACFKYKNIFNTRTQTSHVAQLKQKKTPILYF